MSGTMVPETGEINKDVQAANHMIVTAWQSGEKIPNNTVHELYTGAWTSCVIRVNQERASQPNADRIGR
jgi:hypothetical protein